MQLYDKNNPFAQKNLQKLSLEKTAFEYTRPDMSDVNFEVGGGSASAGIMLLYIPIVLLLGSRIAIKHFLIGHGSVSALDIALWVLMAVMTFFSVTYYLVTKYKSKVKVSGKTVSYKGKTWSSDEIDIVKCTRMSVVKAYSAGKKIISFSWDTNNSELFIAWTKRCGIVFEDKRIILMDKNIGSSE